MNHPALDLPLRSQKPRRSGLTVVIDTGMPVAAFEVDVVEEVIASLPDCSRLVFEAPTKELQTFFVTRAGSDVNLGNVAPGDVIGLETLRLGLRSDTLLHFELERQQDRRVRIGA